ncbi:DUF167 domain-containing protein [Candidatus Thorarchaeota archaeon]|nr:MAG: DUF167 domain-containing protein [Candidatus Thorarchaeota archaeon]
MDTGPVWKGEKGIFLRVIVKPNSKEKELVGEIGSETIQVNLTGPAREGKANTELVKRLSKRLKVSTSSIKLVAGHKSREKILLIEGIRIEEVEDRLSS